MGHSPFALAFRSIDLLRQLHLVGAKSAFRLRIGVSELLYHRGCDPSREAIFVGHDRGRIEGNNSDLLLLTRAAENERQEKLQLIVGTSPAYQFLQARDESGNVLAALQPDSIRLGVFGLIDGVNVHVVDIDPLQTAASLTDVSRVEKYEIDEESYAKRKDTFRTFKKTQLREYENEKQKRVDEFSEQDFEERKIAATMKIGDRCELGTDSKYKRRGTIAFIGDVEFQRGIWLGVCLDEPTGKNDGSKKGHVYFDALPNHGCFVKPSSVTVGDFPEIDAFAEFSDENEL